MGEEPDILSAEALGAEGVQPICKALGHMESEPQPEGHLREIEATFCDQRIHHSIHDGNQDNDQDGVHGLQRKWRGAVTASAVALSSGGDLNIFSHLHLIWLNFNNSLKRGGKSH